MKKILFVTSRSFGGSGKYIAVLAQSLREKGYICELAYYPSGVAQDIELERSMSEVFHLPCVPSFSVAGSYRNISFLRRLINVGGYDWVHTNTSFGGVLGRLAAATSRSRVNIGHTIHAYGAEELTPFPQKWIYWTIERALDFVTHAYVAPSKYMLDYGKRIRIIDADKVSVIHNSLPLSAPLQSQEQRNSFRRKFGLRDSEIVGLFCGRLEQQKGADILINALSKIDKHIQCKILVCGAGQDEDALRALSEQRQVADRIVWAGWQSNLDQFYNCADFFVLPSRWESFGLVFLEAMNNSLPIISTTAQAIPEVVGDNDAGLLCAVDNASELGLLIERMCSDAELRKRLGTNGKRRLQDLFSFHRFVDSHVNWYSKQ